MTIKKVSLINLDQDLETINEEACKRILEKTKVIIKDLIRVTIPMVIGIMDLTTLKEMTLNKEEEEEATNKIIIEAGIKTILETITLEIIHGVKIVMVAAVIINVAVVITNVAAVITNVVAVIIKAIGVMILIIEITIKKENGQMTVILPKVITIKTNVTIMVIILEIKDKIIAFKNLKHINEADRIITILIKTKNGQIITTIRIITKKEKIGLKILQKEI